MTLLVRTPNCYDAERRYVLDVVLSEWLGFDFDVEFEDRSRIAISVAGDSQELELTLPDVLFATPRADWLSQRSMPVLPLARLPPGAWGPLAPHELSELTANSSPPGPIPILFGEPGATERAWRRTATELALAIDIFGSVFYLLTRYEEVVRRDRDDHERFPAAASLAAAEGFLERPIVDEYVDRLWWAMLALWPQLTRRPSRFRLRLTHDVDRPWAALGQGPGIVAHAVAGDLLVRRDPSLAARRIRSLVDARSGRVDRDPFNVFDLLMETSERHGLRSTFYFLAGRTSPGIDGSYLLSDPAIADLLGRIHERGHDVGLHASYQTFRSPQQTRMEFDALTAACRAVGFDQPTWGVRQHYLRFEAPQTWRNHETAGLEHDSTLGFADEIGFRAGTCREYPLFDLLDRRALKLRERPLVVMDAAMSEYTDGNLSAATARIRPIVDACRRHRGDAVLLFHNSSLPGARQRAHYRALVEELVRDGEANPALRA